MTKKQMIYFNVAREMSRLADYKKFGIGCAVVYKHRVISTGYSSNKTDTLQSRYNIYRPTKRYCPAKMHAETMALKPLMNRKDIDFKNVEIYVYREIKNGDPAMSRPCKSCMALIKDLGIRYIYYSTDGGFSQEKFL